MIANLTISQGMIVRGCNDRQDEGEEGIRILTEWSNNRVIRRDVSGLRTSIIVQTQWQGVWMDKAKWTVTPGGIAYESGDVCHTDEWLHESKRQEKRVLVYADEAENAVWIERDWRGPPGDREQLATLDWRTGSRWRIDESGAKLVR